jgi:hypothetical protein
MVPDDYCSRRTSDVGARDGPEPTRESGRTGESVAPLERRTATYLAMSQSIRAVAPPFPVTARERLGEAGTRLSDLG